MKKNIRKKNKTSKASEAKKTKSKSSAGNKATGLGDDYWNRVANDVASGYKNKKDEDHLLNEDQQPDDHIRGDQADNP